MTGWAHRRVRLGPARPGTRLRRRFLASRAKLVAGFTVVALPAGVAVAGADEGYQSAKLPLRAGLAWVASNQTGQLTLLDGTATEVAARVQVARPGTRLVAVQQGTTGYAVGRSDGTVVRVDGTTFTKTAAGALLPRGRGVEAVAAGGTVHAYDWRRGLVATADGRDLRTRGRPLALSGTAQDSVTFDAEGHVWAVDTITGDLSWGPAADRRARAGAASPGRSLLTTVRGRAVLVGLGRMRAEELDPGSGRAHRSVPLDLRPDDVVAASGAADGDRLHLVLTTRRLLVTCALDAGTCSAPVPLAAQAAALGAAVEAGGRVFVPDFGTGVVTVVDLAAGRRVAEPLVLPPPAPLRSLTDPNVQPRAFDLVARDGIVYYNDPDSEHAGVISPDGEVHKISKYAGGQGQATGRLPGGPATKVVPRRQPVSRKPGPRSGPGTGPVPEGGGLNPQPRGPLTITVSPSPHASVGQEVTFTVSTRNRVQPTKALWIFGDGSVASGPRARHHFARVGRYRVSVTAAAGAGPSAHAFTTVDVGHSRTLTIPELSVTPDEVRAGNLVSFAATASVGPPARWEWKVSGPGGAVPVPARQRFAKRFDTPGTYRVEVTARRGGQVATRTGQFVVAARPTPTQKPVCGGMLTRPEPFRPIVLTEDLICDGDGLSLGTGVVLDLNGKAIKGSGRKGTGIQIRGEDKKKRVSGVTVRNGSVEGFLTGIRIDHADEVRVLDVVSRDNLDPPSPPGGVRKGGGYVISDARNPRLVNPGFDGEVADALASRDSVGLEIVNPTVTPQVEGAQKCSISIFGNFADPQMSARFKGGEIHRCDLRSSGIERFDMDGVILDGGGFSLWEVPTGTIENGTFTDLLDSHIAPTTNPIWEPHGAFVVRKNTFRANRGAGLSVVPEFSGGRGTLLIEGNHFLYNGHDPWEHAMRDGLRIKVYDPLEDDVLDMKITVRGNWTSGNKGLGINAEAPLGTIAKGGGNTTPDGCEGPPCGR